jgi:RimJ/RimL family protein N-acetyltransferase
MDEPFLTERLRIRPFNTGDGEAGFALWSDPDVGRFTGGAHTTREQTRALLAAHARNQLKYGFSLWAVETRDTAILVGEAGLQPLEGTGPEIEIGWAFAPSAWGRGYATEAAGAWVERAFGELGLDELIAVIRPENEASHKVARRLDMEPAGRRHVYGAEHDVYRLLNPGGAPAR